MKGIKKSKESYTLNPRSNIGNNRAKQETDIAQKAQDWEKSARTSQKNEKRSKEDDTIWNG